MISIENLSKSFGRRTLWSDVDLTVNSGAMLALVGPSGSGKSTLLNCLGLLEAPSSGAILYDGKDITRFDRRGVRRFRREVLGYLFQNYALIENASVAANLEAAVKPRRALRNNPRVTIAEALDRVGLAGREKEKIHLLSGGEQQRVALARLMVKQPALADEPTGALDHDNTVMVVDILREMSEAGCAVVIATHNDYVRDRCDTVFSVDTATLTTPLRAESTY
ncbi:ATP-binding cassette domain-containing protein [Streptomyces sp. NBC_01006]|uniref:ATP-binding cassette domain-containing protein n=1 Tax=Streptomyces sp. NBC_01006 TaxID=2903716 RepID=UPI00386633C1|nr:ABC transporter ATP-binding protein [Streptomyces sp. NBC_01006]